MGAAGRERDVDRAVRERNRQEAEESEWPRRQLTLSDGDEVEFRFLSPKDNLIAVGVLSRAKLALTKAQLRGSETGFWCPGEVEAARWDGLPTSDRYCFLAGGCSDQAASSLRTGDQSVWRVGQVGAITMRLIRPVRLVGLAATPWAGVVSRRGVQLQDLQPGRSQQVPYAGRRCLRRIHPQ